ncbi:hypothetical protein GGR54DRAFT_645153 [Hypoxylon sp. NC1633]|nr:hypothetical protein GGR54DRAFT_645153 [Hypoxylon sp. NC1633]
MSGLHQDTTAAGPQQPRLRASCDFCGSSKVKCDRGHPNCGRCIALGLACIYGVSRKTGKSQREKTTQTIDSLGELPKTLPQSPNSGDPVFTIDIEKLRQVSNTSSTTLLDFGSLSGVGNTYGGTGNGLNGINKIDTRSDALAPPYLDFNSPDFDEWIFTGHHDNNLWGPKGLGISTSPETLQGHWKRDPTARRPDKGMHNIDNASSMGKRGHDCTREAYDILGMLSVVDDTSTSVGSSNGMPLDYVLRLNREASDRLSRLLTCNCARSPHLALLYASVFARVLNCYEQAAWCSPSTSWIPAAASASSDMSPRSASTGSSPPWSNPALSPDGAAAASTPTLAQAPGFGFGFHIGDLRVPAVLNLQTVSSEVTKAGAVIDMFASWIYGNGSRRAPNELLLGGVGALYQSLSSWLRAEHSRVVGVARARIAELGEDIQS